MRIKWSEKAKRLANKYDLAIQTMEIDLEQRKLKGIEEIGIKTKDNGTIWFSIDEDNMIQADVKLR